MIRHLHKILHASKCQLGILSSGQPAHYLAPEWATHIGRTPEGAYHWLERNSVVESDSVLHYFPDAGRTEFTGHVDSWACSGYVNPLDVTH